MNSASYPRMRGGCLACGRAIRHRAVAGASFTRSLTATPSGDSPNAASVNNCFVGELGLEMRLADFIETHSEPILAEWVAFAETRGPVGAAMDVAGLRDHAMEMLTTIVNDLRTPQTKTEQAEKSKGTADSPQDGSKTPAEVHGAGRAESGFSVGQMVSEYRALRASVVRLWSEANGSLTGDDLNDLMRFNEAIDQSVAESVTRYTENIDRSKEMFVAILGHDLRTPLGAVTMGSQHILEAAPLDEPQRVIMERVVRSSKRMTHMVADLLDFARTRLGSGMPIVRGAMDFGQEAAQAVDEVKAADPDSVVQLNTSGDLRGNWDAARLSQVLLNLIGNAVQHGSPKSRISVTVRGEARNVVLQVHNQGPAIPEEAFAGLFSPFKRLRVAHVAPRVSHTLGLGLYIVEQIVTAHGGSIDVNSDASGTFFTVRLPRDSSEAVYIKAASERNAS